MARTSINRVLKNCGKKEIITKEDISKNINFSNAVQIVIDYYVEKLGYIFYEDKLYTVDKFIETHHS